MQLSNLKTPADISELYPAIFPTKHAAEHLIRQNRMALIEKGILRIVNSRKFLDVERLAPFLEELSAQRLRREV